jgi:hypothetical protein
MNIRLSLDALQLPVVNCLRARFSLQRETEEGR